MFTKLTQILTQYNRLIWIVLFSYFCIVFLPLPGGIHPGLDASWTYVISAATEQKLTYGQDIIFTYGPLGFLIHGAVTNNNFWLIISFRFLVHFLFYLLSLIILLRLKPLWLKFSLFITILFSNMLMVAADYQILFIFLIILLLEKYCKKQYQSIIYSIFMGLICGFCLMTKFSLGIATTGAIILYYGGKIIENRQNISIIIQYIYQIVISIVTAVFQANILLNLLSQGDVSLIKYLQGALEISSGYSSAMSIIGNPWELGLAVLQIVLILWGLIKLAKENYISFPLSIAFVMWITFKHGFIRQDGHLFIFVAFIPLLVFLCLKQATEKSNIKNIKFFIVVHFITLLMILVYLFVPNPFGQSAIYKPVISPVKFYQKLQTILNLNSFKNNLIKQSQESLSTIKLAPEVSKLLKDKTIDIVPSEISLVPANNLNWKPRPIFQSYSTYTTFLDNINAESLSNNPRDYIFYNFQSIDGRHPFFDEPKTFFYIFCHYQIDNKFSDFLETKSMQIMLLSPRKSNICQSKNESRSLSINWNIPQTLDNKDKILTRAKIKIKYSFFGKIYKTLFRTPPVKINITYINGQENSYRIIPENANNGIILSHLPKNELESLILFKGELPLVTKSFSFSNLNSILYQPQIDIDLENYTFSDSLIRESQYKNLFNIQQLKNIKYLSNKISEYQGIMDTKAQNKLVKIGDLISVNGWAINTINKEKKISILLTYGEQNQPLVITETGDTRPDIAQHFQEIKYTNSGWSANFRLNQIPPGIQNIKAWIYDPDSATAIPIDINYSINVE